MINEEEIERLQYENTMSKLKEVCFYSYLLGVLSVLFIQVIL